VLPTVRSHLPPPAAAAHGSSTRAMDFQSTGGIADLCGTDIDAAPALLTRHLDRGELQAMPTTYSSDVHDIAVLEDDGTFFYDNLYDGSRKTLDMVSVT